MPATYPTNRYQMHNANKFKIGLFGVNCSSGRVVTKAPDRWSGNWADNLKMAQLAEEGGIDFLLPLGRWKGYGGTTDYQGESLETLTWASALLASTKKMTVFGTVHAPLINPVFAAKQMVTADQVGEGRFGLNIVVGWNEGEFEMFNVKQREHDARYEFAQEWIDAIKLIWSDVSDVDFQGKYFDLKGIRTMPKPFGGQRPLIMNAGASAVGQSFAVKNCDAFFIQASRVSVDETAMNIANVRQSAMQAGRSLDFYTVGLVVCRATQKEAEDYFRYAVIENADWSAIDSMMERRNLSSKTLGKESYEEKRLNAAINMGGLPIVGDPDFVAEKLALYSGAGLTGVAVSLVNFIEETPFFCEEVLPRLARMGLREASGW